MNSETRIIQSKIQQSSDQVLERYNDPAIQRFIDKAMDKFRDSAIQPCGNAASQWFSDAARRRVGYSVIPNFSQWCNSGSIAISNSCKLWCGHSINSATQEVLPFRGSESRAIMQFWTYRDSEFRNSINSQCSNSSNSYFGKLWNCSNTSNAAIPEFGNYSNYAIPNF